MSLLLNIDTSTETALVALTNNDSVLVSIENSIQKEHAAFIHPAIQEMMKRAGKSLHEVDAIAVTAGPGSYTGIRVGLASAKGLSFALNKPLIILNTLEVMARDVISKSKEKKNVLFCPMIDARRMEVYTALYDRHGREIVSPGPMIIDENSFRNFTTEHSLVMFGSGASKFKRLLQNSNILFIENVNIGKGMATLAHEKFVSKCFSDLVFSEPYYLKEFFDGNSSPV